MPIRQEKFQVSIPNYQPEDGESWVFESQKHHDNGGSNPYYRRVTTDHMPPLDVYGEKIPRFNVLPPTGIGEPVVEKQKMPLSMRAGDSDVSAMQATADALQEGFTHHPMIATDDQYTGEHADLFYGEAIGYSDHGQMKGKMRSKPYAGFAERNNYLDRE